MPFRDVLHQDRALGIIRRALASGRIPHAYLFDGPEGVGKELAAGALAARLLCASRAAETTIETDGGGLFGGPAPTPTPAEISPDACGNCDSCRVFAAGNHPDFHVIDRLLARQHPDPTVRRSKALFLVVDVVRHFLIERAAMKPAVGACRVFIIRDAERMNEEAQNALLKTLEEPPGRSHLILLTSAANRLLTTIRSRCQRVGFGLLPAEFIRSELARRIGAKPDEARTLAALAGGSLGAALRWREAGILDTLELVGAALDQLPTTGPEAFGKSLVESATALAARLAGKSEDDETADDEEDENADDAPTSSRGGKAKVETDQLRGGLKLALLLLAALLRDALVGGVSAEAAQLPAQAARTTRIARQFASQLDNGIRAVAYAESLLDRNVAPQLCCERIGVALAGVPVPV